MKKGHWEEVIELAEKYGFIWFCYGGVAILMTPEEREKRKRDDVRNHICTGEPPF